MNKDNKKRFSAIIVAAGTGKRMNSTVKKQYMELSSHPVLVFTLRAFEESGVDETVIITGRDEIDYVKTEIVERNGFKKVVAVLPGGKERCDSVYEGVKYVHGACAPGTDAYVLIHDGVRPLVTPKMIDTCIKSVIECGACVPGVPEKDTVKEINENNEIVRTLDRKKIYRIQTPQCFELGLIFSAFESFYKEGINAENGSQTGIMQEQRETASSAVTDDAMLVEKYTGHKVKIIDGDYKNIKITTPEDMEMAEFYLFGRKGKD